MRSDNTKDITVSEALSLTESTLLEAGITEASVEAQWILADLLSMKRFELFLSTDKKLREKERERLDEIIKRRRQREPLAYIIGSADFRGHQIKVSRDTLIPRPETELLVDEALSILHDGKGPQRVLEPCTGSGCISVALASEFDRVHILAIDISAGALTIARENAHRNNVGGEIEFLRGDLLQPVKKGTAFDLIVANPPYIPDREMEGLVPEIRLYEPTIALYGGRDGLDCIKTLIRDSAVLLREGGYLLLEIGLGQAERASELAAATGSFENIQTKKDLSGIERIFSARKKIKK